MADADFAPVMPSYWPSVIDSLTRSGLTHADIARELGVEKSTVSRWYVESRRPGFLLGTRLLLLARAKGTELPTGNS